MPRSLARANRAFGRRDHFYLVESARLPEGTPELGLAGYIGGCPAKQRKLSVQSQGMGLDLTDAETGDFSGAGTGNVKTVVTPREVWGPSLGWSQSLLTMRM